MSTSMNAAARPEPTRVSSPEERAAVSGGLEDSWFREAHRAAAREVLTPSRPPAPSFGDDLADAWFR